MKTLHVMLLVGILIVVVGAAAPVHSQDASKIKQSAEPNGLHDFDFLFGEWRIHHRIKSRVENQPCWNSMGLPAIARSWMVRRTSKTTHSTIQKALPTPLPSAHTIRRPGNGRSGGSMGAILQVPWILRSRAHSSTASGPSIQMARLAESRPAHGSFGRASHPCPRAGSRPILSTMERLGRQTGSWTLEDCIN
jgi:hypothetical protein